MDAPALALWLESRLSSQTAREEWARLLEATVTHALGRPLAELLPEAALWPAVEAHLDAVGLRSGARFAVREVLTRVAAEGHADQAALGRWLGDDATRALLDLVGRPGWVDPAWVERLFQEQAMEAVVAETLYEALRDFSTLVPRIVQGVLPSGIGKLAKLGGMATGGVGGRVLEEVERRLEGEIKKWLEKGTRRALEGAATYTRERLDAPEAVHARRDMTRFALEQSGAFHARPLDAETLATIEGVAVAVAESVAARPERLEVARRVMARFYAERGGAPLSEALAAAGVEVEIPYAAWAEATWPAVRGLFEVPEVKDFLQTLAGEILEAVR
ncbi:MAG: hypothetical protein H6730_20555 [Deltaproteobacteria bacterium]|nr:hypothetical protein [Deltaproteobacteria bacterium]